MPERLRSLPGGPLVVEGLRTPIVRAGTLLRGVPVHGLLAPVLRALVDRTGVDESLLADVVVGNAAGGGGNLARLASLTAELPEALPGLTVDRQCGSGLDAVILACRLAQAGAGEAFLAGGAESISTAPVRGRQQPDGSVEFYRRAQHAPTGLGGKPDGEPEADDPEMGYAAETVAREAGISRERQDALALRSHARALAAAASGTFDGELVPVRAGGDSQGSWVRADNGPRPKLDGRILKRFPAAFVDGGTVTAGNSCFDADGAAGVLVATREAAAGLVDLLGRATLAFLGAETVGVDPRMLGLGAAAAVEKLLAGAGIAIGDLRAVEFNEAFAGQVLACTDRLGLRGASLDAVLNTEGGALALGHAYGASGAVSVVRLLARAQSLPEGSLCLAMISSAGGIGTAALFESVRL
ncbi:thiolase family protein [Sinomonas sp. ASV486]|uniref:thiolase family protein n=1 Tax=Sinomonas sp. ASV486 TaxID=3051170 RepID=UPI0027DDF15A|nr:thiolase family protein [Sinomonas sp. ASV486]MDQ4489569.1 thiolase family protein [Sinomonas sp. ASV486]